jgi:hypothetical protein
MKSTTLIDWPAAPREAELLPDIDEDRDPAVATKLARPDEPAAVLSYPARTRSYDSRARAVEARIHAELHSSPYLPVRRLRCRFEEGMLALYGSLPSYYCVQVAISLVQASLNGEFPIRNCLQVVDNKPQE